MVELLVLQTVDLMVVKKGVELETVMVDSMDISKDLKMATRRAVK